MIRILFITLACFSFSTLKGQNLNDHRWKNRVILILSDSSDCDLCQKQLDQLGTIPDELSERKLSIYSAIPGQCRVELDQQIKTKNAWGSSNSYDRYATKSKGFEIVLIGLDGGVKLRQGELLSNEALMKKIDSMPMRSAEMRRRNH